jgi:beta-lactamase regulating signal transducer with metallopeptidase domain
VSDLLYAAFGPAPSAAAVALFLALNVVGGAAAVLVALVRVPARRLLGPAASYGFWALPPLTTFAALLVLLIPTYNEKLSTVAITATLLPELAHLVLPWAIGAAALAALFAVAQLRFQAEVKAGRGGPAVVGFISPRVVMPADDGTYTDAERDLIRAHERAHVARKDPRAAAYVALVQCLCWFNPLAHLAAYLIRLDQELACDAAVVMRRPASRGLYARTLLKTQLAHAPLPLGCYWAPRGTHPLEVRIAQLRRHPTAPPRAAGGLVVLPSVDAIRP